MGDETKRRSVRDRIFERRAAFVAAALASVATGCKPTPCLSVAQDIGPDDAGTKPASSGTVKPEQDAGPEPPPVPCLSPMPPPDAAP